MEIISDIPIFGGFLSTFIAFLIVIGIVVFIHEYGHYIVGRWCGIAADTFSMGMGPVIWSRKDKRGTVWQIAAVPIGGYVKFVGDRNAASAPDDAKSLDDLTPDQLAHSFPRASVWRRALTVLAGPVFNLILAAVIFFGLSLWQGVATDVPTVGEVVDLPYETPGLEPGDVILSVNGQEITSIDEVYTITAEMEQPGNMDILVRRNDQEVMITSHYLLPPVVYGVEPLSAAEDAGLLSGDVILSADGQPVVAFKDLRGIIETAGDRAIDVAVWRNGENVTLSVEPVLREYPDGNGGFEKRIMIGISGAFAFTPATETPSIWFAAKRGGLQVYRVLSSSLNALKHMIIGNLSPTNLQGPLGIAQMSQSTANQGVMSFLSFIAVVSVGIGMLNLFPIPMLDGGHLVFFLIEAVRGQPLGSKTIQVSISIGLAMVLLLMVFVTYNDFGRL